MPVGGDPVKGREGAVQDHERLDCRVFEGLPKRGNQRGQEVHGLADVAVDRGHTCAGGGRRLSAGVTAAQVGQDEQDLPVRGRRRRRAPTCRRRSAIRPVRKRKCELDRSTADGEASTTMLLVKRVVLVVDSPARSFTPSCDQGAAPLAAAGARSDDACTDQSSLGRHSQRRASGSRTPPWLGLCPPSPRTRRKS
ncbi:hypothetical protein GCM10010266_65880 [Streptomyces griseomycini]|nr:hypothetical protein GCM10010266_65880 [Streptomyces griseomycini]GGR35913.1 hypothetical protein GCM10015536_47120 [Streptomyces griseomycini]